MKETAGNAARAEKLRRLFLATGDTRSESAIRTVSQKAHPHHA